MAAIIHHDKDANLDLLRRRKVAIIGYGSQGHAHALNLRDSGIDVRVGLAAGSRSRAKAEGAGLRVVSVAEDSREADLIMVLVPDQTQKEVYDQEIAAALGKGKALLFAHGFSIHFGQDPPHPRGGRSGSCGRSRPGSSPRSSSWRTRRGGRCWSGPGRSRRRIPSRRWASACATMMSWIREARKDSSEPGSR